MKFQKGVGLMEVMICILVLGIAVLGFIALQYRSLELASEALKKVEAANLASNLAERMFVNRTIYTKDGDKGLIDGGNTDHCLTANSEEGKAKYIYCSAEDFVAKDIADIQQIAAQKNMNLNVWECPKTDNKRLCIYVGWDDTNAIKGEEDKNACTPVDEFKYYSNSKCIVIEAF